MKRLFLLLISVILINSCEGGIRYDKIFINENGELKNAHRYVLKAPASGGEMELHVVSFGVWKLMHSSGDKFVTVDNILYPPLEDERYEKDSNFYDQKITINVQENIGKKSRKEHMLFICNRYNGYRAEITIRQAGK